jgi:predicted transcriptional regulator
MLKQKPLDPEKRIERIKRLLDCKSDSELARRLELKQPQIARWKRGEFSKSMAMLVDYLLSIISGLKREITKLKKENASIKKKPE